MFHCLKKTKSFCILFLLTISLVACDNIVAHNNLSEQDINEMLALLRHNSIEAQKQDAGKGFWTLMVPDADLARSLDILRLNGLPRMSHEGLGSVFKKEGIVSTVTEEQARLLYALSEELASTISHIDGVLKARVHLVLPKLDASGKQITSPKASVFVQHRDDVDMQANTAKIRQLVEHAVPDLKYADIAVTFFASAVEIPPPPLHKKFSIDFISLGLGFLIAFALAFVIFFAQRKRKEGPLLKDKKKQDMNGNDENEGENEDEDEGEGEGENKK